MRSKLLHRHDLELLALVALLLVAAGGFLAEGLGGGPTEGAGWRRIDTAAVRGRIQSGDLSGHEARWYRPSRPAAGERESEP